jgi:hypothetical protein
VLPKQVRSKNKEEINKALLHIRKNVNLGQSGKIVE